MTSPAWRVVPVEATEEMCHAAWYGTSPYTTASKWWRILINAAPAPDYDAMAVGVYREWRKAQGYPDHAASDERVASLAAALRAYFEGQP